MTTCAAAAAHDCGVGRHRLSQIFDYGEILRFRIEHYTDGDVVD
jgi:hypothetical protein